MGRKRAVGRTAVLGLGLVLCGVAQAQSTDKEVLPILRQKCFQCHSEALQMSGLDLRTRESMLKGGDKGPAIVPGNAEGSRLYRRVAGLEKLILHMKSKPGVWFATHEQIARYVKGNTRS